MKKMDFQAEIQNLWAKGINNPKTVFIFLIYLYQSRNIHNFFGIAKNHRKLCESLLKVLDENPSNESINPRSKQVLRPAFQLLNQYQYSVSHDCNFVKLLEAFIYWYPHCNDLFSPHSCFYQKLNSPSLLTARSSSNSVEDVLYRYLLDKIPEIKSRLKDHPKSFDAIKIFSGEKYPLLISRILREYDYPYANTLSPEELSRAKFNARRDLLKVILPLIENANSQVRSTVYAFLKPVYDDLYSLKTVELHNLIIDPRIAAEDKLKIAECYLNKSITQLKVQKTISWGYFFPSEKMLLMYVDPVLIDATINDLYHFLKIQAIDYYLMHSMDWLEIFIPHMSNMQINKFYELIHSVFYNLENCGQTNAGFALAIVYEKLIFQKKVKCPEQNDLILNDLKIIFNKKTKNLVNNTIIIKNYIKHLSSDESEKIRQLIHSFFEYKAFFH